MQRKSVTGLLLALVTFGLIVSAALLRPTPQAAAAPPLVITATAEPPTPTSTSLPTATSTSLPTATSTSLPTATSTSLPTATSTSLPAATSTSLPTATSTPPGEAPPPAPPSLVADPAVAKSVDRPGVALGELLRFAITVTNQGNTAAVGVVVEDTLPAYLEYVSASIERGQVVTSGPTVGFWIGRVAPGEVIRGEIVARVVSFPPGGTGRNVVVLRSESPTDRPENNQASTSFQVVQPAPEPLPPGDPVPPLPGEPAPIDTPVPGAPVATAVPGAPVATAVPGAPVATAVPGAPVATAVPEPLVPAPVLPPAGGELPELALPGSLPMTASNGELPYGLFFLVIGGSMGLGLYLWLGLRRRK
jgi:uncharacterized repeat protein (TIGR01451 family)